MSTTSATAGTTGSPCRRSCLAIPPCGCRCASPGNAAVRPRTVEAYGASTRRWPILADQDHEEHEEMAEWMDPDFDPEAFSVEDVNRTLRAMFR